MTFKLAFGLAVLMVIIASISGRISAGYFALVLLYLLLASFLPWLMVPIGVVIVLYQVFGTGENKIAEWVSSFKP